MSSNHRFYCNIVIKGLGLFFLVNLAFAVVHPLEALGRISLYNAVFPGRLRLPYGDIPSRAYNLSLYQLDAMFASHEISSGPKPAGEFRVVLIGDSATWGFLLSADQTLAAQLNSRNSVLMDGRQLRFYNLGYPVMSVTKDLLVMERSLQYQPDLIIWLVTLESLPYDKQLFPPLLQNNPQAVRDLIYENNLRRDPDDPALQQPAWWEETLIGQRRAAADWLRLQLYGVLWAATRIDQDIPSSYTPPMSDLPAEQSFHNLLPPSLEANDLALDVLEAGHRLAGDIPLLLVNEPMFTSRGLNSDIRYNFYYPRWAYDDYRQVMRTTSQAKDWPYLDLWDLNPNEEFTNSAVHLSPAGTSRLAGILLPEILQIANGKP